MSLRLVTGPTDEPVSVIEARQRLRIDTDAADADIDLMIRSARMEIDGFTGLLGRALITQTWDLGLPYFPSGPIKLPLPPCQSVVSVTYYDAADALQTVSPADYRLVDRGDAPSILEPTTTTWPDAGGSSLQGISNRDPFDPDAIWYGRTDPVTIRFVAGWDGPENVPEPIRTWLLARVGALFAQPEMASVQVQVYNVPFYDYLLRPFKIWG